MKKSNQSGFAALEALLILILLAILGFTGFYVYHASNNANKALDTADKTAASQTQTIKKTTVTTFAACKTAVGSKMLQTSPEQCVTKDGKTFTDTSKSSVIAPQSYLDIKQWGLKITLSSAITDAYYSVSGYDSSGIVADQMDLSLQSLAATQCKAGGWPPAVYFRYTAADTDPVSGKPYTEIDGTDHHIGNYYYAYKDGYGINSSGGCQSTSADQAKATAAAPAFKAALSTLQAD